MYVPPRSTAIRHSGCELATRRKRFHKSSSSLIWHQNSDVISRIFVRLCAHRVRFYQWTIFIFIFFFLSLFPNPCESLHPVPSFFWQPQRTEKKKNTIKLSQTCTPDRYNIHNRHIFFVDVNFIIECDGCYGDTAPGALN